MIRFGFEVARELERTAALKMMTNASPPLLRSSSLSSSSSSSASARRLSTSAFFMRSPTPWITKFVADRRSWLRSPSRSASYQTTRRSFASEASSSSSDRTTVPEDSHYALLGVSLKASKKEIRDRFYLLAKLYHPDTSKVTNAHDTFTKLAAAYETLSDPEKRLEYNSRLFVEYQSGVKTEENVIHMRPEDIQAIRGDIEQPPIIQWAKDRGFTSLYKALHQIYMGPRWDDVTRLPSDFEAEERTTAYESLSILQIVSGRQLLGEIKEALPNLGQRYREHQASSWETLLLTSGLLEDIAKDIQNTTASASSSSSSSSASGSSSSSSSSSTSVLSEMNTSWEEIMKELDETDRSKASSRQEIELYLRGIKVARAVRTFRDQEKRSDFEVKVYLIGEDSTEIAAVNQKKTSPTSHRVKVAQERLYATVSSKRVKSDVWTRTSTVIDINDNLLYYYKSFHAAGIIRDVMAVTRSGKIFARARRYGLPPLSFWLWEPRSYSHIGGGWSLESHPDRNSDRPVIVTLLLSGFRTLDREEHKIQKRKRYFKWALKIKQLFTRTKK